MTPGRAKDTRSTSLEGAHNTGLTGRRLLDLSQYQGVLAVGRKQVVDCELGVLEGGQGQEV